MKLELELKFEHFSENGKSYVSIEDKTKGIKLSRSALIEEAVSRLASYLRACSEEQRKWKELADKDEEEWDRRCEM